MQNFKYLYAFTSKELSVIETKRTDLPDGSPLSDIYKWLIISHSSGKVSEFDFKSMGKENETEVRIFQEGELRFGPENGHLTLLGHNYQLTRMKVEEVSEKTGELIKSYLFQEFPVHENYSFRSLKPSDVNHFKKWIFDQEVIRYSMTKFHRIKDETGVIDWFNSTIFDPKCFQMGITDPNTKALIGYAGISALNDIDKNGEYFIFIGDKSYWGQGIASSVTKEIVKIGFQKLNLHRIFLTASSKNPGAIRAYEKAGFVHEGSMREAFFRNNEFSDKVFMGILETSQISWL